MVLSEDAPALRRASPDVADGLGRWRGRHRAAHRGRTRRSGRRCATSERTASSAPCSSFAWRPGHRSGRHAWRRMRCRRSGERGLRVRSCQLAASSMHAAEASALAARLPERRPGARIGMPHSGAHCGGFEFVPRSVRAPHRWLPARAQRLPPRLRDPVSPDGRFRANVRRPSPLDLPSAPAPEPNASAAALARREFRRFPSDPEASSLSRKLRRLAGSFVSYGEASRLGGKPPRLRGRREHLERRYVRRR